MSHELLLQQIADVLGIPASDLDNYVIADRDELLVGLLSGTKTSLVLDNLETVDDDRIFGLIDRLPIPVRVVATSRVQRIQKSVFPIKVDGMTTDESLKFLNQLIQVPGKVALEKLNRAEKRKIISNCHSIPLAVEWTVAKSSTAAEALELSDELTRFGPYGDELLEFSFRRLYESLSASQKAVQDSVAVFDHPQEIVALSIASNLNALQCLDVVEGLRSSHLVTEYRSEVSPDRSVYGSHTLVKRFVYADLSKRIGDETEIRKRLTRWYDAADVADPVARELEQEIRRGNKNSENTFVSMWTIYKNQGQFDQADRCFKHALKLNPKSWKAYRESGELYRRQNHTLAAIKMYETSVALVPRKHPDRPLIFRELGMLLRNSGEADAKAKAIEMFEIAREDSPNDRVCTVALAQTRASIGQWNIVIQLLEPLVNHSDPVTRSKVRNLLLESYQKTNRTLEAARVRSLLES